LLNSVTPIFRLLLARFLVLDLAIEAIHGYVNSLSDNHVHGLRAQIQEFIKLWQLRLPKLAEHIPHAILYRMVGRNSQPYPRHFLRAQRADDRLYAVVPSGRTARPDANTAQQKI